MTDTPDDLRELDRKLRSVRFSPRASFAPELLGRLRRGDQPSATRSRGHRRQLATAAVAVLAVGIALALGNFGLFVDGNPVTVDRCCYDLDGGGDADDGVLILVQRDARVHRLRVYEDLDSSDSYTTGDIVRLDRAGEPAMHGLAGDGITTIERCCMDFDGGGPEDDGLLVIGVPPDKVLMAAIYQTGTKAVARSSGWLLR